jgi:diguanylate cyclase (GGDEF)-like protein
LISAPVYIAIVLSLEKLGYTLLKLGGVVVSIRRRLFLSLSFILIILLAFGIYMHTLYLTLARHMDNANVISITLKALQRTQIDQAQFVKYGNADDADLCCSEINTVKNLITQTTLLPESEAQLNSYIAYLEQLKIVRIQMIDSEKYLNETATALIVLLSDESLPNNLDRSYLLSKLVSGINTENRYRLFNLNYSVDQLSYLSDINQYAEALRKTASTPEMSETAVSLSNLSRDLFNVNKDLITLNDNLNKLTEQLNTLISEMTGSMDTVMFDLRETNQQLVYQIKNLYITMFSIIFFSSIFILAQLSSRINRSLQLLTDGTKRISEGDYGTNINITGNDEFAKLSKSINTMANTLQNAHFSIITYNSQLEKMVDAKTMELLQTKDDLEHLNRKLVQEKEKYVILAMTDALTGLKNRAFLISYLDQAIKEAQRYHHVFSIMLLDIDFFKRVNDQYGHHTGDDVLKALAEILNKECRQSDIIARYGGEEFIIIFASTPLVNAIATAERIREKVSQAHFTALNLQITISAGVTTYRGDTTSSLIERVDALQYQAKGNGRNCIVHDYDTPHMR